MKNGRGERIRTSDPLVPNQVLYQAEPLPDRVAGVYAENVPGGRFPFRANSIQFIRRSLTPAGISLLSSAVLALADS
jgi:hypothetical protein